MTDLRVRVMTILITGSFLGLVMANPGSALAQSYERTYDFETLPVGSDWTTNMTFNAAGNRVLGPFNSKNPRYRDKTQLALKDIPAGSKIQLSFDLYCVGSLDSGGPLADKWSLTADGTPLLSIDKFPNAFKDKEYKLPVENIGSVTLYFRRLPFWIAKQTVTIPAAAIQKGTVTLTFQGQITGRVTEYWALDNVIAKAIP
jgi:hypothetical protein